MSEQSETLVQRNLRSPRSAAIAGILYAIMSAISMILIESIVTATPVEINHDWLLSKSGAVAIVLFLIPVAGIAFLWFTGVIRELIGDREDRFFATIYFGSAIIMVVLTFIWAATLGAMFGAFTVASDILVNDDIYIFGFAMMNQIVGNFALRIAGVYMISIGTVWLRAAITALAYYPHLHRGCRVHVFRGCLQTGTIYIPRLGVSGERLHIGPEL